MRVRLILGLLVLLLLLAPSVSAATYYVDSSITDTNVASATPDFTTYNPATFATTGGSASVYKTLADVNLKAFAAGDSVLFRKGQTWREQLAPLSAGGVGNVITFGSFGTGAMPHIKGSDLVTGFTSEVVGAFTAYYKVISGATPNKQVFENGVLLPQLATKASLTAGSFFWDAGNTRVYVRTSGDNDPSGYTIEWSARTPVLVAQANITIQDLEVSQGRQYGIQGTKSNITVQRCTVHDAFVNNVAMGSPTESITSPAVYDSEIYGAGTCGISFVNSFSGARIQRNNVHENTRLRNTLTGGSSEQLSSGAIKVWCNNVADDGADTLISDNLVWGNEPHSWVAPSGNDYVRHVGIWVDEVKVPSYATLGAVLVRHNTVFDNHSAGIYIEKTTGCGTEYNLIYNNAAEAFTANLMLHANSGTTAPGPSWAYGNVIYGTGWAGLIMGSTAGETFTNHSLKNNIIWSTASPFRHIYFQSTGATAASGNVIDYNLYGSGTFLIDATAATLGASYSSFASWKSASGQDTNSVNANPLFTNTGIFDFTLQSGSPAINVGANLGSTYQTALLTGSTWPTSVLTGNQNSYGAGWEIGTYIYGAQASPRTSTIGKTQMQGNVVIK